MLVISRFHGIVIARYFNDHNPPYFHEKYSGHESLFYFNGDIIDGSLPNQASKLVVDWIARHRAELKENKPRARAGESLTPIETLE